MKNSGVRVALGIFVFLIVAVAIAAAVIWFKIATLKGQLAQDLGDALGAKVEVTSLSFDFWKREVLAAGITLTNQKPEAPWDSGQISQATIHFHLHDLLSPTVPLKVDVTSWRVVLHSTVAAAATGGTTATTPETAPVASAAGSSGHGVQVTQISAQDGEVEIDLAAGRQILIHGVSFDSGVSSGEQNWSTKLQATSIAAGPLAMGVSAVDILSEPEKITFSNLRMQCAQGMITGDGSVALDGLHEAKVNLTAADVPVVMLVAVQWQMKLSGLASGTLSYDSNDQGAQAQGQLSVSGGRFNLFPALGKMTALLGMPDISAVEVDKATTDFAWKDHVLHLTNIDIEKTDVSRIQGQVDVDATEQVDGHLKLGLPTTVVSQWPQIQTTVFPTTSDNFSWADVHLTGTPDALQEDLSPRLLAAGLQSGTGLLKQGTQKAMDVLKSFLGP